jgi:hypothetical protein
MVCAQGSVGRHVIRATGMMDGQNTSGIMPNEAMTDAIRNIVGEADLPNL